MTRGVSCIAIAFAVVLAIPARAETPLPTYPDFTFKRISAPKSGTAAKRITVQIDPVEQAERLASAQLPPPENPIPKGGADPALVPDAAMPAVPSGSYDWFWKAVSPKLEDKNGRFSLALSTLTKGPDGSMVAAPRIMRPPPRPDCPRTVPGVAGGPPWAGP